MDFALVDQPIAICVARNRDRLLVGARRGDGLVEQHPGAGLVGQRLGPAAVCVDDGRVGLHMVEHAVAVVIAFDRLGQPIGAGGGHGLAAETAVGVEGLDIDRCRTVGVYRRGTLNHEWSPIGPEHVAQAQSAWTTPEVSGQEPRTVAVPQEQLAHVEEGIGSGQRGIIRLTYHDG